MSAAFPAAASFYAFHNLKALFPLMIHLHQCFRRMLQVTVHHRYAVPRRIGKSGKNSRLLSKISGKTNSVNLRILLMRRLNFLPGFIPGTIVNKNKFILNPGPGKHLPERLCGHRNHRLLIIRRKYYR